MGPTINKIVTWCMSAYGVLFMGLLFGWLLGKMRNPMYGKIGRWIMALALIQAWLMGCGITTRIIGAPLEGEEVPNDWSALSNRVDAVVLLGGGMGVHEQCRRAEMFAGADRAWTAARCWKQAGRPKMTVSGGGAPAEIEFLTDMGVDANSIIMLEEARNTEEEAKFIKAKLSAAQMPTIALVTSAWHMPRAKMLFERAGLKVMPVPADYEMHGAAEEEVKVGDFFPCGDALARNSAALKEWVARALYWVKGRL